MGQFVVSRVGAMTSLVGSRGSADRAGTYWLAVRKRAYFPSSMIVLDGDGSFLSLYGATCRRLGQLTQAKDLFSRALTLDLNHLRFGIIMPIY